MIRNRRKFEESLAAWGEAQARALEDIKVVLNRRGELDVQEDLGIDTPYFFISQEQSLYMHKARLNNGELEVLASENQYSKNPRYSLSWEDVSQDVIILHDLMDAIYEYDEKSGYDDEKISSYDVVISPMVNVRLKVKDPYNLTEEEEEEIISLACNKILELGKEVLNPENLEIIRLYEEDINKGEANEQKVIYPEKKEEKLKDFEVDLFVLGTDPETTKRTTLIQATSEEEAEKIAISGLAGDGWGVLETREIQ